MIYKDFPAFLDLILSCFSNDFNAIKTVDEINNIIYKGSLDKELDKSNPATQENLDVMVKHILTNKDYVKFGLEFLHNENLINYNCEKETISITPKGFSKIKVEGFVKELSTKRTNLRLQRATWFCSICAIIISLYSILYDKSSSSNPIPLHKVYCGYESCKESAYRHVIQE